MKGKTLVFFVLSMVLLAGCSSKEEGQGDSAAITAPTPAPVIHTAHPVSPPPTNVSK